MVINLAQDGVTPVPFRILVVSARNVARGPAVQRLLRAHLAAAGQAEGVVVGTAGTKAPVGAGLHPLMVAALAGAGIDTRGHLARQVTERRLAQADLVLLADAGLRRFVARAWAPATTVTFTVREFARLAAVSPVGDVPVAAFLERLDRLRKGLPADPATAAAVAGAEGEDVEEPGDDPGAHRQVLRRLDPAVQEIAGALAACRAGAGLAV